jgi:hypothetical protein
MSYIMHVQTFTASSTSTMEIVQTLLLVASIIQNLFLGICFVARITGKLLLSILLVAWTTGNLVMFAASSAPTMKIIQTLFHFARMIWDLLLAILRLVARLDDGFASLFASLFTSQSAPHEQKGMEFQHPTSKMTY